MTQEHYRPQGATEGMCAVVRVPRGGQVMGAFRQRLVKAALSAVTLVAAGLVATPLTALGLGDEVRTIGAGEYQTCAVKSNGTVWCWGYAADGQLGDGTTGTPVSHRRVRPVRVRHGSGALTGVVAVTSGTGHSCALKSGGTVWCWGEDDAGQLGDGTTGDPVDHRRLLPVKVKLGSDSLTGVVAIAAGAFHTCALKGSGTVWCWGADDKGQLGDGSTGDPVTHRRLLPVKVRLGGGFLTDARALSANSLQTCAVRSAGTVWCWGNAASGQLGDGTTGAPGTHIRSRAVEVRRGGGHLTDVKAVAAGGDHTCARRGDGTAWCWGLDDHGQLGDGTTGDPVTHVRLTAVQVRRGGGSLTHVTRIVAGNGHACAARSDGTAWCWGLDEQGQLGDGTTGDPVLHARLKAAQVVKASGPLTGVARLGAGVGHTCAVRTDRTVRCWGRNGNGELGIGTADDDTHPYPSRVVFP